LLGIVDTMLIPIAMPSVASIFSFPFIFVLPSHGALVLMFGYCFEEAFDHAKEKYTWVIKSKRHQGL
jgi:hypothetical protein